MSVFDAYAEYYDILYRDKDYSAESDYVSYLLKTSCPQARNILELGSGTGLHAIELAQRGYAIHGIDYSESMVALAEERCRGEAVTLGDYFDGEHPVILVMGYYECPMLCNLVFNGMIDGLRELEWTAGQEFKMVTEDSFSAPMASVFDAASSFVHVFKAATPNGVFDRLLLERRAQVQPKPSQFFDRLGV